MVHAHEAGSGIAPGLIVSHMNMREESTLYSVLCLLLSLGIWETRCIKCVFHLGYFQDCVGFIGA